MERRRGEGIGVGILLCLTSLTAPAPTTPATTMFETVANIPLRSGIGVDSGGNWYEDFHFF
jgi:hypothetical protein